MSFPQRCFYGVRQSVFGNLAINCFDPQLFFAPPVGGSVSVRVNAGSDDAEQNLTTNSVVTNSNDLEFTYDGAPNQSIGMRFNSITIPKNATITNAYIEFTNKTSFSGTVNLTISGQAIDNAPTFTTATSNITSRVKTTATVAWSPPNWTTVNGTYQTANISTIVQELVNRAGWASGNSLVLMVNGTSTNLRRAFSYEAGATLAPLLVVNYTYCDNVTVAGTIAGNQTQVGNYNPTAITSSVAASGGSGTLEYQWESSTNNSTFTDIVGATTATYDPPIISVTTYYRRKARRVDCTSYLSSNTITKTVTTPAEVCNNTLDDDGDGLADCNDPDCNKISLSALTVSACIDHPLQDVATVSLNVAWTAPPANDSIVVSVYGKKVYVPTGALAGNQTVSFNVPADGSANNTITAYWINSPALCNKTIAFSAPAACSNNIVPCNILYLCGQDKPYDGDAWDHGFINYLDQVNGANIVTPILTKPDGTGYGTYDPMNPSNFVNVNFNNYQLVVISATTEGYLASGLVNYLKNSPISILNGNYTIINDLGMSAAEGSYQYQDNAYINNATSKKLYDFHTISPYYGAVMTKANVITGGTGYLWANANNQTTNTHSIFFAYDKTDALPGVNSAHGIRVYLGYHMNGLYAGGDTGWTLPAPVESYLNPAKHFTLDGKYYLDQAILAASAGCLVPENCDNNIDDDSDGAIDCTDSDCVVLSAAANAPTHRTISDGNWSSAATWQGGLVPSTNIGSGVVVLIEHEVRVSSDVFLQNGGKLLLKKGELNINGANLVIENGRFEMSQSSLQLRYSGNIQLTTSNAYFKASHSNISVAGQNFQNSEGKRVLDHVCMTVNEVFENSGGTDSLTNVCATVGVNTSGNFMNNSGTMYLSNSDFKLPNGNFQNQSGATILGNNCKLWLQNGNLQNSGNWTLALTGYCVSGAVTAPGAFLPPSENCTTIAALFSTCDCGCAPSLEICNNEMDDDGDGLTDCDDPTCLCYEGELEFCTYNLDLLVGETFNIRDFVRRKNSNLPVNWGGVYFTYTAAGANNPTSPTNWKLTDFNAGNSVTVSAADAAPGTGNAGDGEYRVYIVRVGESEYDDHIKIRVGRPSSNQSSSKCVIEYCENGIDDDADGFVDCEDSDCQASQTPIINLNAAALANGALSAWTNTGLLGGSFSNGGTTPIVETVAGRKAVTFDGTDVMTSSFTAPAGITGSGNYTVMVWAYNPVIASEEALLSWSYRGGGDGTNAHINYGSNPDFGAISHWGGSDMAYSTIPTAGTWNHFAITYSGGTGGVERVYMNGVLNNEETKTLNIHVNQPLHLGAARSSAGGGSALHYSGSIASVKVYDQDLTPSSIASIYAQESNTDCYELTNLSCNSVCQSSNLVLNGNFSQNTSNWTAPNGGMTIDPGGPNGSFLILNNSDVAANYTVYQDVSCTPNQEYLFTAGAARHGNTTNAKLYLEFYNGNTLLSKTPDVFINMVYNGAFGYIYPVKGITPANTTKIRIVGFANGTALKIDNISLKLCQNCTENCTNGLDDDGDGLIDCADPDCNLITNGEFNSGTTGWLLHQQTGNTATLSVANTSQLSGANSAFVDLSTVTGTEWHVQLAQNGKSITAGQAYTVSFQAKAAANRVASVMLQRTGPPYSNYWYQTLNLTTTPQTFSFDFVVDSTNTGQAGLLFNLGANSSDVWIDKVTMNKACFSIEICGNGLDDDGDGAIDNNDPECFACNSGLLSNPDFNSNLSDWSNWGNTTIVQELNGNKYPRVSNGYGGFATDYPASPGTTYSLNFKARASTGIVAASGFAFLDADHVRIGNDYVFPIEKANFTLYQLAAVAPAGTVYIRVFAWREDGAGQADFDGYCLKVSTENCTNGLDDDGDALVDCNDPDCPCAITCAVGNAVYIDADNDKVFDAIEGVNGVVLKLYRVGDNPALIPPVASTTTANGGKYIFDNLPPGNYFVFIPATEFASGKPLFGKVSLDGHDGDYGMDDQLGENGMDNPNPITNGIRSNDFLLVYNTEPITGGTELGFDNASDDANDPSDDNNTDLTLDFGFGAPDVCSMTISQAQATPCYKNASGNWVTDIEVTVYWAGFIDGDTIRVSMGGKSDDFAPYNEYGGIWPKGVHHFFLREVPSAGGTGTVNAQFVVRPGCSTTKSLSLPDCACPTGAISGMAFQDFNNNGFQDSHESAGVAGITVLAFNCGGNLVNTTTTNAAGQFSFNGLQNDSLYRIEFSAIPLPYLPSAMGASNGSNVQFVQAPTCHVDMGLNNPDLYCEDNPMIGIPCYVNGLASAPAVSNHEAFVFFPYHATATYNPNTNLIERSVYPTLGALVGQTGATWGVAFQRNSKTVFTSAVIKRHVGLGPLGTGGIYKINVSNPAAPVVANWIDVKTLGVDTGTDPRDGSPGNTLPTSTGDPSYDLNAYDAVGKKAMGDLDYDEPRNTLWFINLHERTLVGIKNVNPNATPTAADVLEYPIAIPAGYSCGASHEFRPWGLKVHEGKVYIGVICTNIGTESWNPAGLKAFVLSFDPGAPASGFSYEAEIDMTYDKFQYGIFKYNNWVKSYTDLDYGFGVTSPIISDIEFDTDGSMILGVADRLGLQMGYYNYGPDKNMADQTLYTVAQSGDLLRLCKIGNNYVLPGSDPACPLLGVVHGDGINGGEHYWGDWGPEVNELLSMDNGFNETAMGAIAMKRGSGEVITTQTDAIVFRSGAVSTYNNITGGVVNSYTLYEGVGNGAQGKATGLGDIEVLCNYQPIEIGNYVWLDEDDDGIQDACEPPLDSVKVSLYKPNGTLIGTTTTNVYGNYAFNETNVDTTGNLADNVWTGLSANAQYIVVVGKVNNNGVVFANGKLRVNGIDALLTFPNIGQSPNNDLNDSDGTILSGMFAAINGFPGVTITTPTSGSSHNADFGFRPLCEGFSVFAGTDIFICTGTSAMLTATGSGGLQPYTFDWSNGLGNGASKTVSPNSTTTYTVTITDVDGCSQADQVTVTVTNCTEACGDGLDNDGDSLVDCADPDCAAVGQPSLANDSYESCPGVVFMEQPIFNDLNIQYPIYSIFAPPTKGSVVINFQGVFTYTPNASICGVDSFKYQVCNAVTGCCDQATVYLSLGDNEAPILQNLPADITINCDDPVPSAPVVFGLDDCPGIYVTFDEVSNELNAGSCDDYTIVRTWTATDICGNSSTASQTITVKDTESPEIFRVYTLANGKKLMAGVLQHGSTDWQKVKFPTSFNITPMVFAQVSSEDGPEAVSPRIRHVDDEGFELRFQEEEAGDGIHANEKIAWFALEPGALNDTTNLQAGLINNVTSTYKLLTYSTPFTASPVLVASVQSSQEADPVSIRFSNSLVTGSQLKLEEEISQDVETGHSNESVGYLAVKSGNILDVNGDFVAYGGKVNLTDTWKSISFPRKMSKPVVVFGGLPTGTDPASIRVRNVTAFGFEAKIDEWDYLNGIASANNVSYVVVEGSIPAFVANPCETNASVLVPGLNLFSVDNCDNQVAMDYTESSELTPNGLIYTKIWVSSDDCGNVSTLIRSDTCNLAAVRIKAYLAGAMIGIGPNESLMRDNLRGANFIPTSSPYQIASSLNPGGGTGQSSNSQVNPSLLEVSGNNAIVDWVLVEIRSALEPRVIVASFPSMLQRDGDLIMANTGSDILNVAGLQEGFYYVRISHRNHLGIMTAEPIYLKVGDVPLIDFTSASSPVYSGNSGRKLEGGKMRLWSGDLNSDKRVIYQGPYNDVFKLFSDVLTHPMNTSNLANYIRIGYENSDINMDGYSIYQGPNNDRSLLLLQTILAHPNNTILLANFMAIELLP